MSNQFVLPLFNVRTTNRRLKTTFYNEKNLILLLFIISIFTVIFILYNLPSDIQQVVNKKNIHDVFIPELNKQNGINHFDNHQHPAPPILNGKTRDEKNKNDAAEIHEKDAQDANIDKDSQIIDEPDTHDDIKIKRDKIKEVFY